MLAASLGLLTLLLVLEVCLRVASGIAYPNRAPAERGEDPRATIVCVGDSFTAGQGDDAYPPQLAEMLERSGELGAVRVVNAGLGGHNTAMLLEALPEIVEPLRPDLVILLAGTANHISYYGYGRYLRRDSLGSRIDDLLFRVRVYRLFRYAWNQLRYRPFPEGDLSAPRAQILELRPGAGFPRRVDGDDATAMAEWLYLEGMLLANTGMDPEGAALRFRWGMAVAPDHYANYLGMGLLRWHQDLPDEATQWFQTCLEVEPEATRCLDNLVAAVGDEGRPELVSFLEENAGSGESLDEYLWMLRATDHQREIAAWVEADLMRMVDYLQQRGIEVILQDYPNHSGLSATIQGVAKERGVGFVSNEARFDALMDEGETRERLFLPDGHCTGLGYRHMASHLSEEILSGGYLAP
jgi:hypothetical protein